MVSKLVLGLLFVLILGLGFAANFSPKTEVCVFNTGHNQTQYILEGGLQQTYTFFIDVAAQDKTCVTDPIIKGYGWSLYSRKDQQEIICADYIDFGYPKQSQVFNFYCESWLN